MQKNVTTEALRAGMGEIVEAVRLRGDRYVIVRRGKPVAALVPFETLRAMERGRARLFTLMEEVAARNAETPDEALEKVIEDETREARGLNRVS